MRDELAAGERSPDVVERWPAVPLSVYRQAYAVAGVPWPGDAEVRRRHRVDDGPTAVSATVRLADRQTVYSRLGNWFAYACVAATTILAVWSVRS